jgi:hypothetical protein
MRLGGKAAVASKLEAELSGLLREFESRAMAPRLAALAREIELRLGGLPNRGPRQASPGAGIGLVRAARPDLDGSAEPMR